MQSIVYFKGFRIILCGFFGDFYVLFSSAAYLQCLSVLIFIAIVDLFSLLYMIHLHEHTTIYLSFSSQRTFAWFLFFAILL